MNVGFKKLVPEAILPTRAHPTDSGLDLYCIDNWNIMPHCWAIVKTGLSIQLPLGYEGQIRPRSGLAAKYGVTVLNAPGTIDQNYTGPLNVILINNGPTIALIEKGDRIAQLVIQKVEIFDPVEVTDIPETDRGAKGFGSTGV